MTSQDERGAIEALCRSGRLSPEGLEAAQAEHAALLQSGSHWSLLELIQTRYLRGPQSGSGGLGAHSTGAYATAPLEAMPAATPQSEPSSRSSAERGPARIGAYRIEGELARGGMGVVYRAVHERLGRRVALKLLLGGASASPRQRERFRLEAEAAARLRHPNVVAVHEVGESADGSPFLVMDLIEGESLEDKIDREGPMEPREAASLIQRLASAVEYAHGNLILHRDLKPANILLDRERGEPLLTDFGLAKLQDGSREGITKTGQLMGTPQYAAPEQLAGVSVDQRADVYALGGTLFALLTGQPPFDASTLVELAARVMQEEPPRPSSLRSGVDIDLDTICLRSLAKVPEERYASAAELGEDLRRFLESEPILARRPNLVERARKWSRRHKGATYALGAFTLLVGLAVGGSVAWAARERRLELDRRLGAARRDYEGAEAALAEGQGGARTALALGALQAAERWHALDAGAEAREARLQAALGLGDEALASEQWDLAEYAYERARGLGAPEIVAERLERAERARTAEADARLARARALIEQVGEDEGRSLLGGLTDVEFKLVAERGPETAELLGNTLYAIAERQFEVEARLTREALPKEDVEPYLAWRKRGGAPGPEFSRVQTLIAVALGDRASSRTGVTEVLGPIGRRRVAEAQADALGVGVLAQARVCASVLGRLGPSPAGRRGLEAYMRAELNDVRAQTVAVALLRWGDERAMDEVYEARKRHGLASSFSSLLSRHLSQMPVLEARVPSAFASLYEAGLRQIAHRDYPAAAETFTSYLEQFPKDPAGYINRAVARLRLREYPGALRDCNRALELGAEAPRVLARRGMILYRLGQVGPAMKDLDRSLAIVPKSEEALYHRSMVLMGVRRLKSALVDLELLTELHPGSPIYLRQKIKCLVTMGDIARVKRDLDKLLELDPTEKDLRAVLAQMHLERGDTAGAERELELVLSEDPSCGLALALRGELLRQRGELERADRAYERALEASPKNSAVRSIVANYLYGAKRYEEALEHTDYLKGVDPCDPVLLSLRGAILVRLRRNQEAVAEFTRALEIRPSSAEALFYRGLELERAGRLREAAGDYRRFLELHGNTPQARRIRPRLRALEAHLR